MRREPKQGRSRERVEDILRAAKRLIGEKGIDRLTMRDLALQAGGPLASVYQYFPNKSAIIAKLFEAHAAETRAGIEDVMSGVTGLAAVRAAGDAVLDHYYERVAGDPASQDLLNAIQADKTLQNLDLVETRRQADLFCYLAAPAVAAEDRDRFARLSLLLFHMAGSVVRLAITLPPEEAARTMQDFKDIVHERLSTFEAAEKSGGDGA